MLYATGFGAMRRGGRPHNDSKGVQHTGFATEEMIAEMQAIIERRGDTSKATQNCCGEKL